MANDIRSNFGYRLDGSFVVPQNINLFRPGEDDRVSEGNRVSEGDILFIYFTPRIHIRIPRSFLYANNNLYRYVNSLNNNTFLATKENFYTYKGCFIFSKCKECKKELSKKNMELKPKILLTIKIL